MAKYGTLFIIPNSSFSNKIRVEKPSFNMRFYEDWNCTTPITGTTIDHLLNFTVRLEGNAGFTSGLISITPLVETIGRVLPRRTEDGENYHKVMFEPTDSIDYTRCEVSGTINGLEVNSKLPTPIFKMNATRSISSYINSVWFDTAIYLNNELFLLFPLWNKDHITEFTFKCDRTVKKIWGNDDTMSLRVGTNGHFIMHTPPYNEYGDIMDTGITVDTAEEYTARVTATAIEIYDHYGTLLVDMHWGGYTIYTPDTRQMMEFWGTSISTYKITMNGEIYRDFRAAHKMTAGGSIYYGMKDIVSGQWINL